MSGNRVRVNAARPISSGKLKRPESEYARQRKQYDSNPRYRSDNILSMELDMPDKTTQDFDGPGMMSRVDPVLGMSLNADDGEDVTFAGDNGIGNPYLQYSADTSDARSVAQGADKPSKSKGTKKSSSSSSASSKSSSAAVAPERGGGSSSSGGGGGASSSSSSSSRPKSASRRREGEQTSKVSAEDPYRQYSSGRQAEEEYPSARGLIRK
jgi:uncharacterized membrane protein YgcG